MKHRGGCRSRCNPPDNRIGSTCSPGNARPDGGVFKLKQTKSALTNYILFTKMESNSAELRDT
jgi:hypothetical protein